MGRPPIPDNEKRVKISASVAPETEAYIRELIDGGATPFGVMLDLIVSSYRKDNDKLETRPRRDANEARNKASG